jgi:hypothetical protein
VAIRTGSVGKSHVLGDESICFNNCTNSDNKIRLKIIDKPFKLEDIKRGETFD